MTSPNESNPSTALNPTHPGGFEEWRTETEASIYDKSKAPIVGPTGSATRAQIDLAATDGNVIPSGTGLWQTFTRNADATFPRIMLEPLPSSAASGGGHSCADAAHSHAGHTHDIVMAAPPDYRPAGNAANKMELGFLECTKDREYSRVTFGTGNNVTLAGITALYACAYLMTPGTGLFTLMAATGNITMSVGDTNTEYTFDLPAALDALKSDIWAVGILQVTSSIQTCKSLLAKPVWQMSAPAGFKPETLYGYAGPYSSPPSTIAYSAITFGDEFVPYFALS